MSRSSRSCLFSRRSRLSSSRSAAGRPSPSPPGGPLADRPAHPVADRLRGRLKLPARSAGRAQSEPGRPSVDETPPNRADVSRHRERLLESLKGSTKPGADSTPHSRWGSEIGWARAPLRFGVPRRRLGVARRSDGGAGCGTRRACGLARTTGEHGWDAELHRIAGTVSLSPKMSSKRARPLFSKRSGSPEPRKQNRWSCAPPAISQGCGARKAGAPKRATSSLRSIAGLPKASIPLICRRRRRYSISWCELSQKPHSRCDAASLASGRLGTQRRIRLDPAPIPVRRGIRPSAQSEHPRRTSKALS